jgi:hypothetical protein
MYEIHEIIKIRRALIILYYILRIQIEMYVSMYWESLLFVHCLG